MPEKNNNPPENQQPGNKLIFDPKMKVDPEIAERMTLDKLYGDFDRGLQLLPKKDKATLEEFARDYIEKRLAPDAKSLFLKKNATFIVPMGVMERYDVNITTAGFQVQKVKVGEAYGLTGNIDFSKSPKAKVEKADRSPEALLVDLEKKGAQAVLAYKPKVLTSDPRGDFNRFFNNFISDDYSRMTATEKASLQGRGIDIPTKLDPFNMKIQFFSNNYLLAPLKKGS